MSHRLQILPAAVLSVGLLFAIEAQAQEADSIIGTWSTDSGNLVIDVYDADDTYAARFVYGDLIVEADGKTLKKDEHNPDPALRSRSLAEVNFVRDLTWDAGESRWQGGTVYQAATGQSASARATLEANALHLRVYRGVPLAGRTLVLVRQED
jgi:uncharacterized protein (DUF2147 family)